MKNKRKKSSGGGKKRVRPNTPRAGIRNDGSILKRGGRKKACGGKKH